MNTLTLLSIVAGLSEELIQAMLNDSGCNLLLKLYL